MSETRVDLFISRSRCRMRSREPRSNVQYSAAQKLHIRTGARYTVTVPWNISIIVLGEGFPIIAEAV